MKRPTHHHPAQSKTALAACLLMAAGWATSAAHAQCNTNFNTGPIVPAGTAPVAVAAADFNRDGYTDFITANAGDNSVSVLLNFPQSASTTLLTYPVGATPLSVAVGDFNGDGYPDIVASNYLDNTISVLLCNADATLQAAVSHGVEDSPRSVAVGDFNRDGKLDIAVTNSVSDSVSILLGNGDGTFAPQTSFYAYNNPYSIAIGDFNEDGFPDVICTNSQDNYVTILIGAGDGTMAPDLLYAYVVDRPVHVIVSDFDCDGHQDIATASWYFGIGILSTLRGNGDGFFQEPVYYTVGVGPTCIAVADLDMDGIEDLAVSSYYDFNVSVLRGQPGGAFQQPVDFPSADWPRSFVVASCGVDSAPDLVIATETLNGLQMKSNTTIRCDRNHNGVVDTQDIAAATSRDCNADSVPDECQHLNGPSFTGSTSLSFNGTSQYVEVPNSQANNPTSFTVELWTRYTGTVEDQRFYAPLTSRWAPEDNAYLTGYHFYRTPDNYWGFLTGDGLGSGWTGLAGLQAVPNAWTHLAATYDNATATTTFYINGVQVAQTTGPTYYPNVNGPLRIGAGTTETNPHYFFQGQVDDVRIWGHVRTAAEIALAMNERLSGNEPGLNTLYQLDEGSGVTASDSAAAGGNAIGDINGKPGWIVPGDCPPPPCPGDFNGDGSLNSADFFSFLTAFFSLAPNADFNHDNTINSQDFFAFLTAFFAGC